MQNLIQLVYISRSTFVPEKLTGGIQPNVARILLKSRANNEKNGLVGVLYFGDNNFFQCLEGEQSAVEKLYEKLLLDPRHKDLQIIVKKPIDTLSFSNWSMKYVPIEAKMMSILNANGFKKFDPYQFDQNTNNLVINLLHETKFSADDIAQESLLMVSNASNNNVIAQKPNYLLYGLVLAAIIILGLALLVL